MHIVCVTLAKIFTGLGDASLRGSVCVAEGFDSLSTFRLS